MEFRTLIFFGLLAVAFGFTLPEESQPFISNRLSLPTWEYLQQPPTESDLVLVRVARSPQRRFEGSFDHSRRHGSSASLGYTHPIGKNWELYGGASRNFKYNDNSAHAGLRYNF